MRNELQKNELRNAMRNLKAGVTKIMPIIIVDTILLVGKDTESGRGRRFINSAPLVGMRELSGKPLKSMPC